MKYAATFGFHDNGGVSITVTRTDPNGQISFDAIRLSTTDWTKLTANDIALIDRAIRSDGCSGPTLPLYRNGCVLHDFWYRLHLDFNGLPIRRGEADYRLMLYIENHSPFHKWSPMAEWRYRALCLFGQAAWDGEERGTPLCEEPKTYLWPVQPIPQS